MTSSRPLGGSGLSPTPPGVIDLDLLDFRGKTAAGGPGQAILPHPRMTARAFVLRPLADLAPAWRHPVSGTPIQDSPGGPAGRTRSSSACNAANGLCFKLGRV